MTAISWKRYDEECRLSEVLTDAARACVDAKAANPTEYLTSYFRSVSKGDVVQSVQCEPVYALYPNSDGLKLSVKLFTDIESSTEAVPLFSRATTTERTSDSLDVEIGAREDKLRAMAAFVSKDLQKKLLHIGVRQTNAWDAVLFDSTTAAADPGAARTGAAPALPAPLQYALSCAAAMAAAKTFSVPLHVALGSLRLSAPEYRMQPSTIRAVAASGEEHFMLPQLILPFLGRGSTPVENGKAGAAPSGAVCLDTLYILPGGAASRRDDRKGVLQGGLTDLLPRLFQAYRCLQVRAGPTNGSAVALREDGAVVMDDFENLVDAVEVAMEAMRSAGLEPGRDARIGLRLCCPATFSAAFRERQMSGQQAANSTSSERATETAATKEGPKASAAAAGAGKKGSAAAGKQSAGQLEDIMYALFAGDAEVTSSQLSVYVQQQVSACDGVIAFVQDVHVTEDAAGAQRLQALLGPDVCVSCRRPFECVDSQRGEDLFRAAQRGKWCADVSLCAMQFGPLTTLFQTVEHAHKSGCSVTLYAPPTARCGALEGLIDVALGVQARYVLLSGLACAAGAQSVAHYFRVMKTLHQQRCLMDLPADTLFFPANLPAADVSAVPELKRKLDKKKRKTR